MALLSHGPRSAIAHLPVWRLLKRFLTLMVAVVISANTAALAQSYPTRPITLIVPFAAGGPTDTIARVVTDRMRGSLGHRSSSRMSVERRVVSP